ncbi:MAG TPA: hypothetical protein VLF40_01875 [Candidatus Saccharimonadales bacterium]|nr:hypothetical protein [Candidatus Saccharimonadales bacterium]
MSSSEELKCPFDHTEIGLVDSLELEYPSMQPEEPEEDDGYTPSIQENAADFRQLQTALDPLTRLAAARINLAADAEPALLRERAHAVTTYPISYEPMYAILPPGIFGDGPRELPVPPAVHVEDFVGAFENSQVVRANKDSLVGSWKYQLEGALRERYVYGEPFPFDPDAWQTYEDLYAAHVAKGTERDLLELWVYRLREVYSKNHHIGMDRPSKFVPYHANFERFVYAAAENGQLPKMSMPRALVMPIGAYGQEFSERLLRATVLTVEQLATIVDGEAATVAAEHADVLSRRTSRGRSEQNMQVSLLSDEITAEPITAATPKAIMQEGALSIMQAVALLMADTVPGYDDPDVLLQDLVNQGVVERFTRKLPMAFVGPLTLKGVYYPNPLEVVDGKLQFTPGFEEHMQEVRAKYVARALAELEVRHRVFKTASEVDKAIWQEGQLGIMCPVAGEGGGIRKLSEAMVSLFDRLV